MPNKQEPTLLHEPLKLQICRPIEVEMDEWLCYMENAARTQARSTIWRKQVKQWEAYANAYARARRHLREELEQLPVSKRWKAD